MMEIRICTLVFLAMFSFVQDNYNENFNCTFSGCAGENLVCYCSAPNSSDTLYWWDGNSIFCSFTILSGSNPSTEYNVTARVVTTSLAGGFTSELVWTDVSTEFNGTEIGCSHRPLNLNTCRPSSADQQSSYTLCVTTCRAPNPPRELSMTQCSSTMGIVTLTWMAPEPALSQFPVTHYNLTCTSGGGDSCNETLPADTTSFNLTVTAGVQYTITVSALSNDRESQNNPQLKFVASFCSDTTPPTTDGTETTTAENTSTPTSTGVETTSTPTTALCSIIGGSIGGLLGLIIVSIIIIGLLYYCYSMHHEGHYDVEKRELKVKEVSVKEGEEGRKKL